MPTILITGANRGIGLEMCKQYLDDDWNVHATCRSPDNALKLNDLAEQYPDSLTIHALDVSKADQIAELKNTLCDKSIDILLNNAGVYGEESNQLMHTNTESWLETFNTNVISPIKMLEFFIDNIEKSQLKTVANLTSKMGSIADNGFGGRYAYRTSKAALNMAMVSASIELKEKGITILLLHPGWVKTDMGGPNGELSVEESVTSLRHNINKSTLADTGSFYEIDGSIIPW